MIFPECPSPKLSNCISIKDTYRIEPVASSRMASEEIAPPAFGRGHLHTTAALSDCSPTHIIY
jgi:hypothetical protein